MKITNKPVKCCLIRNNEIIYSNMINPDQLKNNLDISNEIELKLNLALVFVSFYTSFKKQMVQIEDEITFDDELFIRVSSEFIDYLNDEKVKTAIETLEDMSKLIESDNEFDYTFVYRDDHQQLYTKCCNRLKLSIVSSKKEEK